MPAIGKLSHRSCYPAHRSRPTDIPVTRPPWMVWQPSTPETASELAPGRISKAKSSPADYAGIVSCAIGLVSGVEPTLSAPIYLHLVWDSIWYPGIKGPAVVV